MWNDGWQMTGIGEWQITGSTECRLQVMQFIEMGGLIIDLWYPDVIYTSHVTKNIGAVMVIDVDAHIENDWFELVATKPLHLQKPLFFWPRADYGFRMYCRIRNDFDVC